MCFWSFVTFKTCIHLNETFVSKLSSYIRFVNLVDVCTRLVFPVFYFLLIKKRCSTALLALLAFYSFCHGLRFILYKLSSLFYSVVSSTVNVNGFVFRSFTLFRWVWRGFPLSPLLYVFVAEVLAWNFRSNLGISSLALPGSLLNPSCVSAHADDSSVIDSPSFYVCASRRHFFVRQWGAHGGVASLVADRLVVHA